MLALQTAGRCPVGTADLLAKPRRPIARDYQELKQELGLGNDEGRGWPDFHHHGALYIAADGFLDAERATFSNDRAGRF